MKSMETKKKIVTVVIHAVLIFVSITMLVPFLWMILTAFKSVTEATSVNGSHQKSDIKTVFIHDFSSFALYFPSSRSC